MAQQDYLRHFPNYGLNQAISATLVNERYKGKFLALMWLMWSSGNLTSNLMRLLFFPKDLEMFLLQWGINETLLKEKVEVNGRKLRLM